MISEVTVMFDKYASLQVELSKVNPCVVYSLNSSGVTNVSCCLNVCNFFGMMQ